MYQHGKPGPSSTTGQSATEPVHHQTTISHSTSPQVSPSTNQCPATAIEFSHCQEDHVAVKMKKSGRRCCTFLYVAKILDGDDDNDDEVQVQFMALQGSFYVENSTDRHYFSFLIAKGTN